MQERLGKLMYLEEAAEDWAENAAVPVELVLSLGQARFGIQADSFENMQQELQKPLTI